MACLISSASVEPCPSAVQEQINELDFADSEKLDKPGKLTHLRRMKLTMANGLPRFDLSLG